MNDVLAIPRHRAAPHRCVRPLTRARLRAQEWTHPSGVRPSAWRPHLAERAYAAELIHAERARAAAHPAPELAHLDLAPVHLHAAPARLPGEARP
jgi:hypothetical protein